MNGVDGGPDRAEPVWVITGMSGAGKATALRALEAAGMTCIDNLPPGLLAGAAAGEVPERGLAVVVDARHGDTLQGFIPPRGVRVLFLDARDDVLVRRLAESTRPHPLAAAGTGRPAVDAERAIVAPLRAAADAVLDTSDMTAAQLATGVVDVVRPGAHDVRLVCTVTSFGFKYGPLLDADWVVDARFLRNPFWEADLWALTGLDEPVRAYVLDQPASREFIDRLSSLLAWTAERAVAHGRNRLEVGVGCTGGRHRSVVLATALAERLEAARIPVVSRHRDVERPPTRPPTVAAEARPGDATHKQ